MINIVLIKRTKIRISEDGSHIYLTHETHTHTRRYCLLICHFYSPNHKAAEDDITFIYKERWKVRTKNNKIESKMVWNAITIKAFNVCVISHLCYFFRFLFVCEQLFMSLLPNFWYQPKSGDDHFQKSGITQENGNHTWVRHTESLIIWDRR